MDLILDIKVRPPVTDLRGALQTLDGQHREPELIVDGDLLLVLLNESGIRGGRKVTERSVSDSGSGVTLGRDTSRREGNFFGFCITEDRESNSPGIIEDSSATMSALHEPPTHLNFVL